MVTILMLSVSTQTNSSQINRILVAEDDKLLNAQISELLLHKNYDITQCFDGDNALSLAVNTNFDLILLDIMLPQIDGLRVLNLLRNTKETPVIVVSAKHAEEERIKGLSAGADDYLAKPFNSEELLLRIDAILRRTKGTNVKHTAHFEIDGLAVDYKQQLAYVYRQPLSLTPTEFSLIWTLVQQQGEVLSKPYLYQAVLHKRFSQYDRSLDMHMSRVRKKLIHAGWDGGRLQTVHGKGYLLK